MKQVSKIGCRSIAKIGWLHIRLTQMWLFILFLLLFAGSCTQTNVEDDLIPSHALKDVDAVFNLNVLANQTPVTRSITFTANGTIESDTLAVGIKDSIQTKAIASLNNEQENQIVNLWVGQFDVVTGECLFSKFVETLTSNTINLKLKQNKEGHKSRVYFVSNAGDLSSIADTVSLKKHKLLYESTDDGLPNNNLCKMVGTWEGELKASGEKDVNVDLTRLIAKITFKYVIGANFKFIPTSVVLKNAPNASQLEVPMGQLADIDYKSYNGAANSKGSTIYWYLPENMAGTVNNENAVDSEKKKIGTGVSNATCIELTGEAEQGGVIYKDVTFRFFPGDGCNNYDILRNTHYTMTVSLVGIDVSDARITVGKIPDIEIDDADIPAKKGGTKTVQITARPGQKWKLNMPDWLSVLLNDTTKIPVNSDFSYQGPAKLEFKAETANPTLEKREASFEINESSQKFVITQDGSTLKTEEKVSLKAEATSKGSSSFTTTEGLPWSASLINGGDWLSWDEESPVISGSEAPGNALALNVMALTSNPSSSKRTGAIIVKSGSSVGTDYPGLKQEITVEQEAATLLVSETEKTVEAKASKDNTSTFTATAGLSWNVDVTSTGDWLSLKGTKSGTKNTTGGAQNITYDAVVNPDSTARAGIITVKAGNAVDGIDDEGLTKTIAVTQSASSLIAGDSITLAATKDATGVLKFTGTEGLGIIITPPSWITLTESAPKTTTGSEQSVGYKTNVVNLDSTERTAENIEVKAGNITQNVSVKQSGSIFTLSKTEIVLEDTAVFGSVMVKGTKGLPWTVSPSEATNGFTPATVFETANGDEQTLIFNTSANEGGAREATFAIAVKGGNHSKKVTVKQKAGLTIVTVDAAAVSAYLNFL